MQADSSYSSRGHSDRKQHCVKKHKGLCSGGEFLQVTLR